MVTLLNALCWTILNRSSKAALPNASMDLLEPPFGFALLNCLDSGFFEDAQDRLVTASGPFANHSGR